MLRTVALRAQKHLTRRCALSLSPSLAHVVLPNAVGRRPLSSSASDASVKAVVGSAYLRSVASDVYALQNLFQSLASGSDVAHNLERCITRVLQCHDQQRRVFVTGMGKSGAVAQRLASTLSSISISSQWVHGGEWVHGELGGLKHGDVVIIISHSGRTSELLPLPDMFRKAGCCVMAIVGDGRSPLSKDCDLSIVAPAEDEANCPVPSRSIIVQVLAVPYLVNCYGPRRVFGQSSSWTCRPPDESLFRYCSRCEGEALHSFRFVVLSPNTFVVCCRPNNLALVDILQACHSTLTKVLAASPEIVSSAIKTNPQALPQIVREDSNILATVFATVPQCLGDTLEKHPEFFVDLAHRKPALVSRLFAEHPDLLLEPLETNPALFTTFLVYHRSVLPDFNDPDFDPTVFKLKTTKKVEIGVQTSKNLNQGRRKLRAREKLRRECEELLEPLRAVAAKDIAVTATSTQTTDAKTEEELLNEEAVSIAEILNEIARLYVAKMAADEHDDSMNRKRQSLADFMMELYTLELGFKSQAKKKLVDLLIAAKQIGNVPEAMRIKWFRRFLNAIPGDRPLPQTALDFFLLVLHHLIPGGQLSLQLESGSFTSCTVSQCTLKTLADDPLVSRLFDNKEQCERMLAFQHISTPSRRDITGSVARSSVTMLSVLPLDDVLDSIMKVWMQYQLRVREEWALAFKDIVSATGVAHFDAFSTMVRSKLPELDNRALMKIYNSCGEENEQGEFTLFSVRSLIDTDFLSTTMSTFQEDFTFTMAILQEQHVLCQYTSSSSSTDSSAQLLSPFATPPVSGRH
ncbi:hypothetical protein JG687_00003927 [Phytophthora cactorum]|uniref:SIS domain-containing protein n=1 Tax=Phytophthora cactorum TaxID=29920 RepID=A0A8T1UQN4_9STRA|nr:hypothetical protein JG687_00003927 [Phytophthora cactorum]